MIHNMIRPHVDTLELVTWGGGTDEQVGAMVDAAQAGTINISDYWSIGDVRTITIDAFNGARNNHYSQDIDIVISSFDEYEGCGNVLQFDFKDALETGEAMNDSNSNWGGYGSTAMYATTMPALANALPAWLKSRLITFSCKSSAGGQSSTINTVTNNKLALRSQVEISGSNSSSFVGEGTKVNYYNVSSRWIKKRGHNGSNNYWWTRSPVSSHTGRFVSVDSVGGMPTSNASNIYGVAPFGVI